MKSWALASVLPLSLLACAGDNDAITPFDVSHPQDGTLRLNHLQAKGTHNSYHLRPSADAPSFWDYEHAPLYEQFADQGVRAIELDIRWSPELNGFRVLHLPRLDALSTCDTFVECLLEVRRFSRAHPGHHPLFVQVEPKETGDDPEPAEYHRAFEAEVREVFNEEELISPDSVRKDAADLVSAIHTHGWPTLRATRGRVLFFFDCQREFCVEYANQGLGLKNRLAFVDSEPGDPFLAIRVLNSAGDEVAEAVANGNIVRTRAASLPEALDADAAALTTELNLALDSGAHLISTDVPAARPDIPFVMKIPGGTPSRCNPVVAPAACTSEAIEDPALLAPRQY